MYQMPLLLFPSVSPLSANGSKGEQFASGDSVYGSLYDQWEFAIYTITVNLEVVAKYKW